MSRDSPVVECCYCKKETACDRLKDVRILAIEQYGARHPSARFIWPIWTRTSSSSSFFRAPTGIVSRAQRRELSRGGSHAAAACDKILLRMTIGSITFSRYQDQHILLIAPFG